MVGMFVQKYEKIFFDFYCGKNFSLRRGDVETWRRGDVETWRRGDAHFVRSWRRNFLSS